MSEEDSKKYYVKKNGKWKGVSRDEANLLMGIKASKAHETPKETEG